VLAGAGTRVHGQSEGRTTGVICVVGAERNQLAPIVVLDVPEQTFIVYEYDYTAEALKLTAVRTYRYDRLLREFGTKGVSVDQVRQEVSRRP
jgi:predicted transcriptional regulator YdeE